MNIGYCTTCHYPACPTPKVRNKPDGNCSHWTDGKEVTEIDEHITCSQCDGVVIDNHCSDCESTKETGEEG